MSTRNLEDMARIHLAELRKEAVTYRSQGDSPRSDLPRRSESSRVARMAARVAARWEREAA